MSEVYRETHRRLKNLIAAKSMERAAVGAFAGLMSSSEPSSFSYSYSTPNIEKYRLLELKIMQGQGPVKFGYLKTIHFSYKANARSS